MSAGFEVGYIRDGSYTMQIDQDHKGFTLKRKIRLLDLPYMGTASVIYCPWDMPVMTSDGYTFKELPQYQLKLNDNEQLWGITVCEEINHRVLIECPAEKDIRIFTDTYSEAMLADVYIYTFGFPEITGNCGLQVFNGAGEIVFNAAEKPLKIYSFSRYNFNLYIRKAKQTAIICNVFPCESKYLTWFFEVEDSDEAASKPSLDIHVWLCQGKTKQATTRYKGDGVNCTLIADVTNY